MVGEADGHTWLEPRRLMTEQFGPIEQLQCTYCERDFITVLSTGRHLAVCVSVMSFWILPPDVTERWLSRCPGMHQPGDDEDRLMRISEVTMLP